MRILTVPLLFIFIVGCGEVAPAEDSPDAGPDPMGADGGAGGLPETTLTSAPPDLDNHAVVEFVFASSVAGAEFLCSVDGAAPASCESPHEVTVGEGLHGFSVAAVSAAGEDPTPATHEWTADLTAPNTTIVTAPTALDNSVEVSFEFSVDEADATTTCSLDGGSPVQCTSPHLIDNLTDGDHELTVTATDLAGNAEPEPAQHTWTVDTSAPDTVIEQGPSGVVRSTNAELVFVSPDAGAGATFECSDDRVSYAPCTSPYQLSGLPQGEHGFSVRVTDATGNVDPSPATRRWTVDTIAPAVTITDGPEANSLWASATVTFEFTATDANLSTVQCRIYESGTPAPAYETCSSPAVFNVGGGSNIRTLRFAIRAEDAAGNLRTVVRSFQQGVPAG